MIGQFLRFALVGLLGLLADTGSTLTLERSAGLAAYVARPPAIMAAMLATWWLNRGFSFQTAAPVSTLVSYAAVAVGAGLLNRFPQGRGRRGSKEARAVRIRQPFDP